MTPKMPPDAARDLIDKVRIETKTFRLFVPNNFAGERKKFFKDKTYNPQFKYPNLDTAAFKKNLDKLKTVKLPSENDFKSRIFERRLEETKLKLELFLNLGIPDKITKISEALYLCKFDEKSIFEAKKDASLSVVFKPKENLSAGKTAKAIKEYLSINYGIKSWRVKVKKNADFYIQIRFKKELITINEDINWDFTSLDSVLAHEIDGHVIRALNALNQVDEVFQNPFPFYIKTEEGLASYLGDYLAEGCEIARRHHAIKYLGGFIALNTSFREVYNFFIDFGFPPDLAFQRAFRLKRGFTDTSSPGCFAREAIYYEGMLEVKRYVEKGGNLEKLFAGKIGLEDLKYIPLPKDLIIPKRLS